MTMLELLPMLRLHAAGMLFEHGHFLIQQEPFPEENTEKLLSLCLLKNSAHTYQPFGNPQVDAVNMLPKHMMVGCLEALVVTTDDKAGYNPLLDKTMEFHDFAEWEGHFPLTPNSRNLFINTLKIDRVYEGHKVGHVLIRNLEDEVQPDFSFLYCHPLGLPSTQRSKMLGVSKLEAYYAQMGFQVVGRNEAGYALMKKDY